MGLLNKLFGSQNKQSTPKQVIRAQYKDEKYFKSEVKRCEKWMANDAEDYQEYIAKHGQLLPFHYISSCALKMDMLSILYSMGEPVSKLRPLMNEPIDLFAKGWSTDYQGYDLLLQMTSLAILLEVSEDNLKKIADFLDKADQSDIEEQWKPDSLIFFLIGKENRPRQGNNPYERLYRITQLPKAEAEKALVEYLDKWYGMHKGDAWYDSHLRVYGYSGYWAWEVAAVVKVMNLDDAGFKDNPYYPHDVVHWNG